MKTTLAASIIIQNKNNVWIDDKMVTSCNSCHKDFWLFNRKHHCRNCGNIFCYTCVNYSIVIPDFITDRPNPADYWNISHYITSLKGKEEKVCKQCFVMIKEKVKIYEQIVNVFSSTVSIEDVKQMSESSVDIVNHYLDHLRNIQYYLPNHNYTDIDKRLLWTNASYFSKHSKYLVHLIKTVNWNDKQQLILLINILNGEKVKSCSDIYCTRTCQESLSCDDCVNILYSCSAKMSDILTKYLFDIIMKTPERVILCHLTFFISLIKRNTNKTLQTSLHALLNQSIKLQYHTYWFLNNSKEQSTMTELTNINNFIELSDPVIVRQMHQEYMFFVGLINNLHDPTKYLVSTFYRVKPISIPYDPETKLIDVNLDDISVKNSYTKPVVIPFITNKGTVKILLKKESIMNDVTVLNLMTLCDIILNETFMTNFGVVIYPTMPITTNAGMIEIIDDAESVHAINHKKKTILQHIIESNENKVISEVMNRYMYSLVSYTLHSYFLGLGDRHLQNIMITNDGAIFHIDFGFILGTDAYPLTTADIKLNTDMLDVIGGSDSNRYQMYLETCAKGVTIIRKYFNMFFILLSQYTNFKEQHIEKFVLARFQPRQSDMAVVAELMTIIKQSNNAYSDIIRDFLHYHTQERTLQNKLGVILKTAIGTVKSFKYNDYSM